MLPALSLFKRELVRFYRQRDRVIGALATPLVFWLLIGSGFGRSYRGDNYLEYLYPGIMILTLLFTAIFSTISIIEDRREGFLQSVLVAPIRRSSMVLGKIFGATAIAVIQGALFLILAPFLHIPLSFINIISVIVVLTLVGAGLSSLGFLIAWRSDSTQGFHAVMNLFLMPMWLLSGAFFPASGAPEWIQWIIKLNPLTYGVSLLRSVLGAFEMRDQSSAQVSLAVVVLFSIAAFCAHHWLPEDAVPGICRENQLCDFVRMKEYRGAH
jgi:ABC-2 type transport system permease protein